MRALSLSLCLLFAVLLTSGCSKPWSNPDYPDAKQAEYRFDKDSTDCSILASEQYPLDKDKQLPIYRECMEKKGWIRHEKGDGIPLKK